MNKDDKHIIEHSLGFRNGKPPKQFFRAYFCAEKGAPKLERLVKTGLMERGHIINDGLDQYYFVTKVGAELVGASQFAEHLNEGGGE